MKKATFLLLITLSTLYAQVQIHQNLNIEDGLIYSQVLMIHEDQQGYMWFGTASGISRWDGISFQNYLLPDGLPDNNCKWIAEAADSTLYFATRKGLARYKNGTFSAIPNLPNAINHWIHSMLVSKDNLLYLATDTSGLWVYEGSQFTNINKTSELPSNSVCALAEGRNGQIYFATDCSQLFKLIGGHPKRLKVENLPVNIEITYLYEDANNRLWVGTNNDGVFIVNSGKIKHIDATNGLPGNSITQITDGPHDGVFVGTGNGLAILNEDKVTTVLNEQSGLSNPFVWFVQQDRNGIYYIGTDGGGVDIFRPGIFQTFNTASGLPHNTVWAICEYPQETFYFATDEGLAVYNQNTIDILNKSDGLSDNMVLCLHKARDGKIYAGTNEQGVDILQNGKLKNINKKQGLDAPSVWTINEDARGNIYFGLYDAGIDIWNGNKIIKKINSQNGLPSDAIVSSFCSSDGSLYFGTDGAGVVRIKNLEIDTILLAGNTIWSIYEDKDKNLYFGTNDQGLIFKRDGKWDTLNVAKGLSHNTILGIMEDDSGAFYLTADNSLNVVEFNGDSYRVRLIGRRDGLASNECNQGAYLKDSKGRLWIGTVKGVSCLNPELYKPNKNAPQMHLTRVQLFEKELPLNLNSVQHFKYNENYLKFDFTGIDLSAAHKVVYKYRLTGVDADWLYTSYPHVQYTSLNDGNYNFEVMAANEWGIWSNPVNYAFTIAAPVWERWWFILLSIIFVLTPLIIIIRQRVVQLLTLERLRAKIAADLHDDIGAGLSEINILSAVTAAKTPPDVKPQIENELNKIGNTARALIENMSDIVWLVNPKKDALTDLISRLKDSFSDIFDAKNILFRSINAEELQRVHLKMEYRQHLFMILKEAIHNAVKYSGATEISLKVELNGKTVSLKLQDNGAGFDTQNIKNGNGLINMQERAALIGAQVEITSSAGKGTTVQFNGRMR